MLNSHESLIWLIDILESSSNKNIGLNMSKSFVVKLLINMKKQYEKRNILEKTKISKYYSNLNNLFGLIFLEAK